MTFDRLYKLISESSFSIAENLQTGQPVTLNAYRATQTLLGQPFKIATQGDLGSGIYLTTSETHAESYLNFDPSSGQDSRIQRRIASVKVHLNNPVVVKDKVNWPIMDVLLQLGLDEEKTANRIEKDYENRGAVGKWVQMALQKKNYDGIIVNRGNDVFEIVVYNPNSIKEYQSSSATVFDENYNIINESNYDDKPFATCILQRPDGKVLILKRGPTAPWMPNRWALPGGGVEDDETPLQGAIRECEEEIGITPINIKFFKKEKYKTYSKFVHTGNIVQKPKLNYEHSDFAFVSPEELDNYHMVPKLKELLLSFFNSNIK